MTQSEPKATLASELRTFNFLIPSNLFSQKLPNVSELNPVRAAMVEDPGHYRWTSYRINGLGQPDARVTPHSLYHALGQTDRARQTAYRALFRAQVDCGAIDHIRLALNQNQPLGNGRFYTMIEQMMGTRREARPRGRPRLENDGKPTLEGQGELEL